MWMPRTAWGLDIGESSVKAVKMRRTKVGAEILAFDSVERTPPTGDSGDKDYHLRAAVSTLAERNSFRGCPLIVSIPEPVFSRFIPLPPVDKKRIPEVVRYEARQQIPFPIEEVVWDYQPVREATEPGEETEVAIFSLRSQFVYALVANLSLCKLEPTSVLPIPLALYNFLTFDRDVAKGTIVVDLGAGSTDIVICDPENFRVRNITVSGNGITRALADRLKISMAEAEALKRQCSDPVQAERLFKLIQPTLSDLVGQVQRTIGFFKSQIHNVRIEQALLLGNTFRLPGVAEYFAKQLGVDLMPANVLERITLGSRVDGSQLKAMLPSLGVAIGLALQGIGVGRVQVNLMPRELLLRQEMQKKRPCAAAVVACLAVMLGASYLSAIGERNVVERQLKGQQQIGEIDTAFTAAEKAYRDTAEQVKAAIKRLEEPVSLSGGGKGIGYRGCLAATNALNQVLNGMSDDIFLESIEAAPAQATIKRDDKTVTVPCIRFTIIGERKGPDLGFLERQVEARFKSVPAFTDVSYMPRRVLIGEAEVVSRFVLTCNYPIER